jgi:hypothetical protein
MAHCLNLWTLRASVLRATTTVVRTTWLALMVSLLGCATPAVDFEHAATARGLVKERIEGTELSHVLYRQSRPESDTLTIYIDGDGRPGDGRDPTTRGGLVLDLISVDPGSAVLIGRPCYYEDKRPATCQRSLWTTDRYSAVVVASMASVVQSEIARANATSITLAGYSGGGALAMLIAPRITGVDRVVTIAANLDTTVWAAAHGQKPPSGSLNPATQSPMARNIEQVHLAGSADRQVPLASTATVAKREQARLIILDGYDHQCCWAKIWPAVLAGQYPK